MSPFYPVGEMEVDVATARWITAASRYDRTKRTVMNVAPIEPVVAAEPIDLSKDPELLISQPLEFGVGLGQRSQRR